MSAPGQPKYLASWKPFDLDKSCANFLAEWWGESGEGRLEAALNTPERVLQFNQPCVNSALHLLGGTDGTLMIRDEMLSAFDRLEVPCKYGVGGVVYAGQPGIGKSYLLMFILVKRMSQKLPTLLTTSEKETYLINEHGIFVKNSTMVDIKDLPTPLGTKDCRIWSLIDSSYDGRPPFNGLTVPLYLFPIHAVTPQPASQYKGWREHNRAIIWILNPWNKEDIAQSVRMSSNFKAIRDDVKPLVTADIIKKYIEFAGPCPRDVIHTMFKLDFLSFALTHSFHACSYVEPEVALGLYKMKEVIGKLSVLVLPSSSFFSGDEKLNRLFLIRGVQTNSASSDQVVLGFKSLSVQEKVLDHLHRLRHSKLKRLYGRCYHLDPEICSLANWLFEALAVQIICGMDNIDICVIKDFRKMGLADVAGQGTKFVDDLHATQPVKVTHHDDNGPILLTDSEFAFLVTPVNAPPLPIDKRRLTPYDDLETEVFVDFSLYYYPRKRNSALFDSFFFQQEGDKIIIWLIQIPILKFHNGSGSARDAIIALKRKALAVGMLPVELRYVLVASVTKEPRAVAWDLPMASESETGGYVFIQYLDVSYDRWMIR